MSISEKALKKGKKILMTMDEDSLFYSPLYTEKLM